MPTVRKAWTREDCRWDVAPAWAGAREAARGMGVSPLVAQVLHNRGLDEPAAVRAFLNPKLTDLHPPGLLAGIDAAAERLARAVREGQKVCIYGDYDVDGMTGLAILYRCLKLHGAVVEYYVPHRLEEGYGVNAEAVAAIAAEGAKLLVTVDCGITAVGPAARAAELGMDVIVTDHHSPDAELPPAVAVVHPSLPGGEYPNADLCGAGVAFKLAWHFARVMCGSDRVNDATRTFLLEATSLAALGTIADVVPLTGENRILAVYGLRGLAATEHAGIRALIAAAKLEGQRLDAYHVGFVLAPRLNAAGRMGHARLAVELLARAEPARCREIAAYLDAQNAERQRTERAIFEQAAEMVERGDSGAAGRAIVLSSPDWHAGVVGIVASRLVDRYNRPTVLIAVDGEAAQGSARSIKGFHMRDALAAAGEHLVSFGGHAMAGGLRLEAGRIEQFAAAFATHAAERLSDEDLRPTIHVDAETALGELSLPVVECLERFAPFGQGNPSPLVAVREARPMMAPKRLGRGGGTLSLLVGDERSRLRCVGFGMGELADRLAGIGRVDLAGRPVINRYKGRTSVELHLRDIRWQ